MKCCFCNKELVPGEQKEFETLEDHVSDPNATSYPLRNTFVCPYAGCTSNVNYVGFWDDYGDFYSKEFIDMGSHVAMDSWAMKASIELYKTDENFTFYKGLKYRLGINYQYTANTRGEVLTRKPKLVIETRYWDKFSHILFGDNIDKNHWCKFTSNISMLNYVLKEDRRLFEVYLTASISEIKAFTNFKNEVARNIMLYTNHENPFKSMILNRWDWWRPIARFVISHRFKNAIKVHKVAISYEKELENNPTSK